MRAQPLRGLRGQYYLALGLTLVVAVAALGGASRADELQQSLVRLIAIIAIASAFWPLEPEAFRDGTRPFAFLAAIYLLLLLQLVPLPPDLWARMSGRAIYAAVADQTGSVMWRPWTISPDLTLNAIAALLPATAAVILALALGFDQRMLVARLVVAIACLSSVLGLLQFAAGGSVLHLFRTTSEGSAVGLFANRNHQAVLLACALPLLAATSSIRLRRNQGSPWRITGTALVVGAILLIGLAATGSRMGILLGLIGLCGAAVIILVTIDRKRSMAWNTTRVWATGVGLFIAVLAGVSILLLRSGAAARLASEPVDHTRLAALRPMLHAAHAFMPFGSGFGTFQPAYQQFEPAALLSTIYLNQAHNEPMQLVIEGGVPALALLLLFLGWWFQAVIRTVSQPGSISRRGLGLAMAVATFIMLLSSLVDYPLRTPLLSAVFGIACVELFRSTRRPSARHDS